MKQIRFAPIPKCASRSLKTLGLLGEVEGRHHKPIQEYPDWQKYDWHLVRRDRGTWYAEWWDECAATVKAMAALCGQHVEELQVQGLQFVTGSFHSDMQLLKNPESLKTLPARLFVNAWLPDNAVEKYAKALLDGKDFYDFCHDTITGSHICKEVPIDGLDAFLTEHGLTPIHANHSRIDYACC